MTEPVVKADDRWTVAEAKAKFSELIEHAQRHGPQTITRNGKQAVVVVDAKEWERKTKRVGNLAEFFASSPLHNSGLKIRRRKDRLRSTNLRNNGAGSLVRGFHDISVTPHLSRIQNTIE